MKGTPAWMKAAAAVAVAVAAATAVWLGARQRDATDASVPTLEAVRVGLPTEGFFYVPLYLAMDAGLMAAEGLAPELIQFRGGGASIAGLASRSVEFCICAIHNAINATAKGTDITLVGTVTGQYASNIVIREDVAERLHITPETPIADRLTALRGLRIGATGVGGGTDFLLRYLARKAGLSAESDFTVLFLGSGGAVLSAFAQRRIDAFVYSSPTSDIGLLRYRGVLLLDMSRGQFEDLRGYPSMALSARRSWLEPHHDQALRFVRALARANRMIHDEPDKAQQILRRRFASLPQDVYDAAWRANVAAYPETPVVFEQNVQRALTFLAAVQNQPIPGAARDYFDNTYADAAVSAIR